MPFQSFQVFQTLGTEPALKRKLRVPSLQLRRNYSPSDAVATSRTSSLVKNLLESFRRGSGRTERV